MDLAKSRPDSFCWILRISTDQGVLWVRASSQIARTRADFALFSAMSETAETEVWSKVDLNSQTSFSSGRRQPVVPFSDCELFWDLRSPSQQPSQLPIRHMMSYGLGAQSHGG